MKLRQQSTEAKGQSETTFRNHQGREENLSDPVNSTPKNRSSHQSSTRTPAATARKSMKESAPGESTGKARSSGNTSQSSGRNRTERSEERRVGKECRSRWS